MSRTALSLSTLAAAALLTLTACGGSAQTAAGSTADVGGTARFDGRFPGANGKIAAISGKTLQVQGISSQVAVTYTAKTAFSEEVSADKAAVKVGSCVFVSAARSSTSSGAGGSVAAGSVRITPATDGSCTQGLGGGFGGARPSGAPSGMPTDMPSGAPTGMPSGMPSGMPGGRGGFGFGAAGKVTAVSGTGFTVASAMPSADGSSSSTDVTVTVSSDTTYTTTKSAGASDLRVGLCASANGSTDDTGAVTAQRISLSRPVNGECTAGFGRFGGGAGGAQ